MNIKKEETNNAIVTKLTNVRKHTNADSLQIATVCGDTVIVGLDAKDGDKVVYFDSNLCITRNFLSENNLLSKEDLNKDTTKKGYFPSSGRVKVVTLRGERSYGFTTSLESIATFVGCEVDELEDGMEFQTINDINVCSKYIPPVDKIPGDIVNGSRLKSKMFSEHWDTKQFKKNIHKIPSDRLIYIEEKIHGTSGRTAHARTDRPLKWYEKLLKKIGVKIYHGEWKVMNGSRRTNITESTKPSAINEVFDKIKGNIQRNEQVYYELAGLELTGRAIQKGFPYGCEKSEHKTFLYRVAFNNDEGKTVDMGREYVYKRAEELGLEKPVLFEKYYYTGNEEELLEVVQKYTEGKSAVDGTTVREGVVVWFEDDEGKWTCLKNKSFEFLGLEGKDGFVDSEDLA